MSPTVIDGKEVPTINEYVEQLQADIKALRIRVTIESEVADYWYTKYMELKRE
jgi:hypothetical protein